MKIIYKIGLLCATIVVVWSCRDLHNENAGIKETTSILTITRTANNINDNYYWYKGKKIVLNKQEGRKFVMRQELNKTRTSQETTYTWDIEDECIALQDTSNILYSSNVYQTQKGNELILSNRFFVKLKQSTSYSDLVSLAKEYRVCIESGVPGLEQWYVLSCDVNSKFDAITTANIFYESGICDCSHPDPKMTIQQSCQAVTPHPSDELFSLQWYLHNDNDFDIDYPEAATITTGSPDVTIAVLDIGLPYIEHEDLALSPSNVYQICEDSLCLPISETTTTISYNNHATNTVGIIAAQHNDIGVSGIAPNCSILPISIADSNNNSDALVIATAFNFAKQHASIISCSWYHDGACLDIIDDAIENTINNGRGGKGCVVVFAAGNTYSNPTENITYPANCHEDIIVVGAVDENGLTFNSCHGDELDIVAPGTKIVTTTYFNDEGGYDATGIPNGYVYFQDTSSACPQVAAVAGLILSQDTTLTMRQVTNKLLRSASKNTQNTLCYHKRYGTWDEEYGYGMLNAVDALEILFDSLSLNYYHLDITNYFKASVFIELKNMHVSNSGFLTLEAPHISLGESDTLYCSGVLSIKNGNEIWNYNPSSNDTITESPISINPFPYTPVP